MTLSGAGSVASVLACVFSGVGLCVGLWQALLVHQKRKFERKAWKLYVAFRAEVGPDVYSKCKRFEPGTENFELAELLVAKGMFFRRTMGSYGLTPERQGGVV